MGRRFCFAQHGQRHCEDQAEDDDLQHRAVGNRFGDVLRKDVQDRIFRAELADGGVSVLVAAGN